LEETADKFLEIAKKEVNKNVPDKEEYVTKASLLLKKAKKYQEN